MNITEQLINQILSALDKQIAIHGGSHIELLVCGGTALAALGLVSRTTKDVDILAEIRHRGKTASIHKIEQLPDCIIQAAAVVQRDFGLPSNWLNIGPASMFDLGLPDGIIKRAVVKEYGHYLSIYFISRLDQIYFKLYAAVDQGGYHSDDLIKLKPAKNELISAARWCITQDVSVSFKLSMQDYLMQQGFYDAAKKI